MMKNKMIELSCLAIGCAFAIFVICPNAFAHDEAFDELFGAGVRHSPDVRKEELEVESARFGIDIAISKARPNIIARGNASVAGERNDYQLNNVSSSISSVVGVPSYIPTQSASVLLSQPIFHGGGIKSAIRSSRNLASAERYKLLSISQQFFLSFVDDCVAVDMAFAAQEHGQSLVRLKQQALTMEQKKMLLGSGSRGFVESAKQDLANAEAQELESERSLTSSELVLGGDVGRVIDGKVIFETISAEGLQPDEDAILAAIESSPEVREARYNLASARDNLTVARADSLPQIDVNALAERDNNARGAEKASSFGAFIVQLSIPLYAGGGVKANIARSHLKIEEAEISLAAARDKIGLKIRSAIVDFKISLLEELKISQARDDAARATIGAEKKYAAGEIDFKNILDQRQVLIEADFRLAQARLDVVTAYYSAKIYSGLINIKTDN